MNLSNKIYHLDQDELSKTNLKVINNIHSNENVELANQLLAQAYLFLNTSHRSCLSFEKGISFSCLWCKGCEGCKSDDGYCSKYCLHADNCELGKFVHKLEQSLVTINEL